MKNFIIFSLLFCAAVLKVSSTPVPPQDTTTSSKVELEPEDALARLKRYKELGLHETIVPKTQPYEALHPNKKAGVKLDSSVSLPSAHVRFVTETHIPFDPASSTVTATPPLDMVPSKDMTYTTPQANDLTSGNDPVNNVSMEQKQDQSTMTRQSTTPVVQAVPTALENAPGFTGSPVHIDSQMHEIVPTSSHELNQRDGNISQQMSSTEGRPIQTILHESNDNASQQRLNGMATSDMRQSIATVVEDTSTMKNMTETDIMANPALQQSQDVVGMGHMPSAVNNVPVDAVNIDNAAARIAPIIPRIGTEAQN